jgi:hypothetical protein
MVTTSRPAGNGGLFATLIIGWTLIGCSPSLGAKLEHQNARQSIGAAQL